MPYANNEDRRSLSRNRREAGLCPKCGSVRDDPKKINCGKCRAWALASAKRCQQRHFDKGLCKNCGSSDIEDGYHYCKKCRTHSERQRQVFKDAGMCRGCGKIPPAQGTMLCDVCLELRRKYNRDVKMEALIHYGGSICACCGEENTAFLTFDHINNDGAEHRRKIGRVPMAQWLKRNKWPDGFQVLCANCNLGKEVNGGICPHKTVNYPTEKLILHGS